MLGARFTLTAEVDLQKPIWVRPVSGCLFSGDSNATLIRVTVLDGGAPADISGDVCANVIRPDGKTVVIDEGGVLDGNICSIVLPQEAYAIPGIVYITVQIRELTRITTLAGLQVSVYRGSTEETVTPTYDDIDGEAAESVVNS